MVTVTKEGLVKEMNYDMVDEKFTTNLQKEIEFNSNFSRAAVRDNGSVPLFIQIYAVIVGNYKHTVQSLQCMLQVEDNINFSSPSSSQADQLPSIQDIDHDIQQVFFISITITNTIAYHQRY